MKQTIFFAILILCLLAIPTLAQTADDRVLVQGNPALTQSMIDKSRDVFEFVFGGELTTTEKTTYQTELIKQWENNDAVTIKSIQDLVSFRDQVSGASKEKLLEVQKQLRESLIKDLRSQADKDVLAKLLINAHDRIQGLNVKQGGGLPEPRNVSQPDRTATSSQIPTELLGEWVKSQTSAVIPYNPNIGSYAPPSGEKIILHFYPDGTYQGAYFVQSSRSVGCTMTVYMPSNGVYRVEGNTLHLNEKKSRTLSKDTCIDRYNYEKDNKPGTYAYPAYIDRDEYGTKLVLTMNDGKHNFYFNNGKSLIAGK